jgi:hypothetical protein
VIPPRIRTAATTGIGGAPKISRKRHRPYTPTFIATPAISALAGADACGYAAGIHGWNGTIPIFIAKAPPQSIQAIALTTLPLPRPKPKLAIASEPLWIDNNNTPSRSMAPLPLPVTAASQDERMPLISLRWANASRETPTVTSSQENTKSNALAERMTPTTAKISRLNEIGASLECSLDEPVATRETIVATGQVINKKRADRWSSKPAGCPSSSPTI